MSEEIFSYQGFEIIYHQHAAKMYSVCLFHLQDEEESKEVVQSIFVSLWERRDSLSLETPLEHYLMRAVKLRIFELIRNKTTRDRKLREASAFFDPRQGRPDEELIGQALATKISELTHQLPTQCQTVFRMSREEGLTNKQISATLTLSEKTVEAHLTKALKFLRVRLREFIS